MRSVYTELDIKIWSKLYCEGWTLEQISEFLTIPKSSIRKRLKDLDILRPPQQKGRSPWNKGKKTGQIPWNKGLKEDVYPYESPNKGKPSPFKNLSRDQKVKDNIAKGLRETNYNGYGFYKSRAEEIDTLYLVYLTVNHQKLLKIGRTFYDLSRRFPSSYSVKPIKIWYAKHKVVYSLEQLFLKQFDEYQTFGPTTLLGRTECFAYNSPIDEMIEFIDLHISLIDMTISSQVWPTGLKGSETTGGVESP